MEVGRLIFIVNRSIIHQPGKPANRVEVNCQMSGFTDATVNEALAIIQSMNLKCAEMTSGILRASGVQQQVKAPTKNGG